MTEQRPLPCLLVDGHPAWHTPELTSLRKLPPRATFWPFPTADAARARMPEASLLVRCLSGEWDFRLFNSPEEVTPAALESGAWRRLAVPGTWTMQLRNEAWSGEAFIRPHYTNVQMPFADVFPRVPALTATGVYRTQLAIPDAWSGQRIVLHVAGCEGVLFVYLDGAFVGLNKDSRTPAEYDLTDLVQPGATYELLCVNPRFSDASWLEDQDHWWQAGIHRDVYLYATPRTFLQDVAVQTELASDFGSATLRVRALLRSISGAPVGTVRMAVFAPDGSPVLEETVELGAPGRNEGVWSDRPLPYDSRPALLSATVAQPRLWSAETPELYSLVLTLDSDAGAVNTALRIGFRGIEIHDRQLLVNGRPVMIHGMNRHDHSDEAGMAVTRELMLLDARTMKAHNVNAVRTSHYPNDPYWLDLCDEYGFYVIDETNLENHALPRLSEDGRVAGAYLERVRNMVERDKNHACVIIWSLGNESGYGPNHDAAAGWIRHTDPSRPLHYEGAISRLTNHAAYNREIPWSRGHAATDILCPMYASIDSIVAWVTGSDDPRPLILCEYAHAMGNSTGSLADYYAAFEQHHGLQGGFIWEWIDHGIRMTAPDGTPYWVYGGDFGDEPHDGNFVADGMVWPDRTPHPGMQEFKFLARPVLVTAVDVRRGNFRLENRRFFVGLSDLRGEWRLLADGEVVQEGTIMVPDVPPQEYRDITIPVEWPEGVETFVEFRFTTVAETQWSAGGYLVAWDQLPGPAAASGPAAAELSSRAEAHAEDGKIILIAGEHRAVIDTATGELVGFGADCPIQQGPMLNLWRAPTDNDTLQLIFGATDRALPLWQRLGLAQLRQRLEGVRIVAGSGAGNTVAVTYAASGRDRWEDVRTTHTYTLLDDGTLRISTNVQVAPELVDLPRVGLRLQLKPELERLQWYGRGPWENYSDRKASSLVGRYSSTITAQYVPYIMPQEHGHKTDVRWLRLTDAHGHGLEVTGDGLFEFNALHHAAEDLATAKHTPELTARPQVFLSLDHGMRGLGTGLGMDTLPQYRLNEPEYRFTFDLRLV